MKNEEISIIRFRKRTQTISETMLHTHYNTQFSIKLESASLFSWMNKNSFFFYFLELLELLNFLSSPGDEKKSRPALEQEPPPEAFSQSLFLFTDSHQAMVLTHKNSEVELVETIAKVIC